MARQRKPDAKARTKAKAKGGKARPKAAKASRGRAPNGSRKAAAAAPSDPHGDLVSEIERFVDDPLGYVEFAFDWGEGDLEGQDGPDDWQRDLLRAIGDKALTIDTALQVAVAAGHGVGKSALVAWIILWAMSTRPHLNGVVTANTKNQLTGKTWRELAVWHARAINRHWFEWTATKFAAVVAPDTWFVAAVPWSASKPEAFAGLHAEHVLMIFDEASAIDDIIWETAEGALTTPGAIWCCFGNPTRNTGRFRECFGRFKHRWLGRQIDSRTAKMASKAQMAQWLADYGEDSDFFRIRVRGVFPRAGSSQFISSEDVAAAMRRRHEDAGSFTPRVMGIDVARFGDDQSVVLIRDGDTIHTVKKWRGLDTVTLANHAAELINAWKPDAVFDDGVGVGAGVVDNLRAGGFRPIEVNGGFEPTDTKMYANLRAEMWGKMRDWIRTRAVLPNDPELEQDLCGIEYGFSGEAGAIQLEKKADMKKRGLASPDIADALSFTFARPIANKDVSIRSALRSLSPQANVGHTAAKLRYRRGAGRPGHQSQSASQREDG